MADLNLNAVDVLRKITGIFDRAGDSGIATPKFVNERFQDKLAISYADELELYDINPMLVGYLLGNKSRWAQPLCKYMTLQFLRYICEESGKILKPQELRSGTVARPPLRRGFDVQDLTNPREKPIRLLNYSKSEVSAGRIDSVPRLYIDNARTISIKARVKYPNVSKRRQGVSDAANWKWIDLRWQRSSGGYARLMRLPNFQSASNTIGSIRDLEGRIAKFSYCTLAKSIKDLAYHALAMINKDRVSDEQTAESADIFDLANLIQKQTIHFSLAMGQRSELRDLFTRYPRYEGPPQVARINDGDVDVEEDVFVIIGSYNELADMMTRPDLISAAAPASSVDAASIDLYYGTGTNEELHALIFTTYTRPHYESAHLVEWDNGVDFEEVELLTEPDLEELLSLGSVPRGVGNPLSDSVGVQFSPRGYLINPLDNTDVWWHGYSYDVDELYRIGDIDEGTLDEMIGNTYIEEKDFIEGGMMGQGVFFTYSEERATYFATELHGHDTGYIMAVRVRKCNIYDPREHGLPPLAWGAYEDGTVSVKELKRQGFDGYIEMEDLDADWFNICIFNAPKHVEIAYVENVRKPESYQYLKDLFG